MTNSVLRNDVRHFAGHGVGSRFVFFFVPGLIGITCLFLNFSDFLGNLISAMSIFAGFLVNAILLMFSLMDRIVSTTHNSYVDYVNDLTEHMIFSLYLSVISVVCLILSSLSLPNIILFGVRYNVVDIFKFIAIYFTVQFFIILLKIVDRLFKVFQYNISHRN